MLKRLLVLILVLSLLVITGTLVSANSQTLRADSDIQITQRRQTDVIR
jgi:hypothetical protein